MNGSASVYRLIGVQRTNLSLGPNMEEGPVSSNEVVGLASGFILYVISIIHNTDFEIDWALTVISI